MAFYPGSLGPWREQWGGGAEPGGTEHGGTEPGRKREQQWVVSPTLCKESGVGVA